MRRSRWTGAWFVLVAVFFSQTGLNAESQVTRGGPGSAPNEAAASPATGGGGGGEASPSPDNVIPVLPGDPTGIDAVPQTSPSPNPAAEGGGGGGGPAGGWYGPFIRVLPGGDEADWVASPSPSPAERPVVD